MAKDSSRASMESRPSPSPNSAASGWMVDGSTLSLSVCTINVATSRSRGCDDIVSSESQKGLIRRTHGAIVTQKAAEHFVLEALRKSRVLQCPHNRFRLDAGLGRIPQVLHERLHVTVSRGHRKGDAQHRLDVKAREREEYRRARTANVQQEHHTAWLEHAA